MEGHVSSSLRPTLGRGSQNLHSHSTCMNLIAGPGPAANALGNVIWLGSLLLRKERADVGEQPAASNLRNH